MLQRIEMQMTVGQFDAAVRLARDVRVVRDHQDGVPGFVKLAENLEHDFFVGFVEISRGLVGKNHFWLVDQRARDGYALLLAAGELRGEMRQTIAEADALQRFFGLFFVREAVEILREHHVFHRGEIRHEMKLLENEADFFGAVTDEFVFTEFRKVDAIDDHAAGGQRVQPAENIDERGFPGTGRAHERDPLAGVHAETDAAEGAQNAVLLGQIFDDHLHRRSQRRRWNDRTHASPRNTDAGRMLASRRSGNALRIATIIVNTTATGYTISRGRAATPKTALPSPIDRKMPSAAPIRPPARPSSAASARNSRSTRRIEPPMAFIKPTSIFRSIATLVIAAITQSPVSSSTIPTVAVQHPS